MFAKKEIRKPTHSKHISNSHGLTLKPEIAKEFALASTQQNINKLIN